MPQFLRNAVAAIVFNVAGMCWFPGTVFSDEPANVDPGEGNVQQSLGAASSEIARDDVGRLAAKIDALILAKWREDKVAPAPQSDDAEFLRRVTLDLAGRIPSVWEVREFLSDDDRHKRRKAVDRLLNSPAFFSHLAVTWRTMLFPQGGADFQLRFAGSTFDVWLRQQLIENSGYDKVVREILAFSPNEQRNNGGRFFYQVHSANPENLAAATSRFFLGVRLECAQCHDHPFSHWKQEEFWSFAAFFAGIERGPNGQFTEKPGAPSIAISGSEQLVEARFLGGETPKFMDDASPRRVLTDWITSSDNPYFARAVANQIWAHLFGVGIVDPPDDFDESNPPSHPELLDELAREFAAHNFDVQFLIRSIIASRTYQLTSRMTDSSQKDPRRFARHSARSFTAGQLFDSLAQAASLHDTTSFRNRTILLDSPRDRFQQLFANQSGENSESQATILQSLMMMNGEFIEAATDPKRCATLAALLDAPFLSDTERIETLYLATLSRPPRRDELDPMREYIKSASARNPDDEAAAPSAYSDIMWALLNSSEFAVNH